MHSATAALALFNTDIAPQTPWDERLTTTRHRQQVRLFALFRRHRTPEFLPVLDQHSRKRHVALAKHPPPIPHPPTHKGASLPQSMEVYQHTYLDGALQYFALFAHQEFEAELTGPGRRRDQIQYFRHPYRPTLHQTTRGKSSQETRCTGVANGSRLHIQYGVLRNTSFFSHPFDSHGLRQPLHFCQELQAALQRVVHSAELGEVLHGALPQFSLPRPQTQQVSLVDVPGERVEVDASAARAMLSFSSRSICSASEFLTTRIDRCRVLRERMRFWRDLQQHLTQ